MRVEQPPTGPNSGPTNRLCISLRSPKERRFDPKTWTRRFPRWRKATCGMYWGEIVDDEGNGTRIWPRQKASPMMKVGLGCWRRSGVLQEENVWDLILSALLQWSCRWTWGHFWLNFYMLPVWFQKQPLPFWWSYWGDTWGISHNGLHPQCLWEVLTTAENKPLSTFE